MNSKYTMPAFLLTASVCLLSLLAPTPVDALGTSGGAGCETCLPLDMITRIAEANSVDGNRALRMMDILAEESFDDLRVLQSSPSDGCSVFFVCDAIPEPFFRTLLDEVIERKRAELAWVVERRGLVFTTIAALVGLSGLGLGVFNTRQAMLNRRRKPNLPGDQDTVG